MTHAAKCGEFSSIAAGILLLLFVVGLSSPLQAGSNVKTAWDENTDFSKYRTYAWAPPAATSRPLLAIAIRADVDAELKNKGLTINPDHPDIIVNVYGSVDSDSSIPVSDPTFAATGRRPVDGVTMWTNESVGTVSSVSKGTLVIDMSDASTKRPIWRAIAKDTLKEKSSELQKQVQASVAKMFQDFPPSKSKR